MCNRLSMLFRLLKLLEKYTEIKQRILLINKRIEQEQDVERIMNALAKYD